MSYLSRREESTGNQALSSKGRCERVRNNAIFRESKCPLNVTITNLRQINFTRLVFFDFKFFFYPI